MAHAVVGCGCVGGCDFTRFVAGDVDNRVDQQGDNLRLMRDFGGHRIHQKRHIVVDDINNGVAAGAKRNANFWCAGFTGIHHGVMQPRHIYHVFCIHHVQIIARCAHEKCLGEILHRRGCIGGQCLDRLWDQGMHGHVLRGIVF